MSEYIFKRYEKKYLISDKEYLHFSEAISSFTVPDKHGESDICNIYCDTPDFRIIRASVLKPVYKEKLRLRCYGVPADGDKCFLELKKKYKGIVYKRRIKEGYANALSFLNYGDTVIPDSQIKREIDYFRQVNALPVPSVNIFYRRMAYYDKNDKNVRITFDGNLLYRSEDTDLRNGIYGTPILPPDRVIAEIKTAGAMPLWLTEILSEMSIYPVSFSKYGTAYNDMLKKGKIHY